MKKAGGCLVGFPFVSITTVAAALERNYQSLVEQLDLRALPLPMMSIKNFESPVGFDDIKQAQQLYLPKS